MLPSRDESKVENWKINCSTRTVWLYLSIEFLVGLGIFLVVKILDTIKSLLPKPPRDLTGNVVLIIGAATSFGSSLTKEFVRNGCSIVCVDKKHDDPITIINPGKDEEENGVEERFDPPRIKVVEPRRKEQQRQNNEPISLDKQPTIVGQYRCDLLNGEDIRKTAGRISNEIGGIDILVSCVGNSGEDVFDTASTTLMSHYWAVMAFLPLMLNRERAYVVSVTPIVCTDDAYISTRAAIAGLMESLGHELSNRDSHFTVLAVAPTANGGCIKDNEQRVARDVVEAVRRDQSNLTISWISRFFYKISCMIYNAITIITQWFYTQGCDYVS